MNTKFEEYMKNIGITTTTISNRVSEYYDICFKLLSEKIEDIFIDDIIRKDGTRKYTDITFFTKNYVFSVGNLFENERIGFCGYKNAISLLIFTKKNYNFDEFSEKSRLSIVIEQNGKYMGEFKASKNNCDYLKNIYIKYLLPNVKIE